MNNIALHTDMPRNLTMIPNAFLDHYMAGANGEFLKIYLYLLRWAGCAHAEITTNSMADFFNMTENDIKRALRFWEQEQLLRIGWAPDGSITAICLCPVTAPYRENASRREAPGYHEAAAYQETAPAPAEFDAPETVFAEEPEAAPAPESQDHPVPAYSVTDLQHFMDNDEVKNLFLMFQELTGKPLNQNDMNTIVFFYDELGMSGDLIEHLFEYCISGGHRKLSYMQAVAIGWTESGIRTVADAKTYCAAFNKQNTAVMNAFGIKGRYLSDNELSYIRRWTQEYRLSQELIVEACRRTILTAHSASFQYADSILERWKNNQVRTLDDVTRLDAAFEKSRAARTKKAQENKSAKNTSGKKPASRFHNFNQRTYDYSDMEVEFVKKLHSGSHQ
ncbi:DnaD domain protein [Frisingicoccus sp.]|uniref:DnaD domain protein n=1 Tax=Frisingicoccus sp. TaxID=1918627 RepID=UPI003AB1DB82